MTATNHTTRDSELERVLALLRFSIALFLTVWAFDKIVGPDAAITTFSKYYAVISSQTLILVLGILQLALIAAFAAGFAKTLTYGAVTVMHAVSTFASWPRYLEPLERPNILFWAAIPILAAMILLFVLRHRDRLLTVNAARQN